MRATFPLRALGTNINATRRRTEFGGFDLLNRTADTADDEEVPAFIRRADPADPPGQARAPLRSLHSGAVVRLWKAAAAISLGKDTRPPRARQISGEYGGDLFPLPFPARLGKFARRSARGGPVRRRQGTLSGVSP